jgi:hypothetical protein
MRLRVAPGYSLWLAPEFRSHPGLLLVFGLRPGAAAATWAAEDWVQHAQDELWFAVRRVGARAGEASEMLRLPVKVTRFKTRVYCLIDAGDAVRRPEASGLVDVLLRSGTDDLRGGRGLVLVGVNFPLNVPQ